MSTRRRRRPWTAPFVAFVALVAVPQPVAAQEAPSFSVSFDGLIPGVPQTQSATIALAESAWFRGLAWIERTGILADATMTVRICAPGGSCADGANPGASPRFPAGTLTVDVTATLPADALPDSTGTAVGGLTFGNDDEVPETTVVTTTTIAGGGPVTQPGGGPVTQPGGGGGSGAMPGTGAGSLQMALWAGAVISVGATLVAFTRHRRHGAVES